MRLVDVPVNYRTQVLLLLSKFWYNSLRQESKPQLNCMRDIDMQLLGKKFVSLEEYTSIMDQIKALSGRTK